VAVTNTAGAFRFQPSSFGCGVDMGGDICLSSGNHNFNTTNRDMRYDTRHETTVRPSVERLNLFLTGRYDLTDSVEAFGEVGYYSAHSRAVQPPVVNLNQIWIPASNYYNPFGPMTFADGTLETYDTLILATGSTARKLTLPGADRPDLLELRTLEDAERLKAVLAPGRRLAVVGGGYVGLEAAASAPAPRGPAGGGGRRGAGGGGGLGDTERALDAPRRPHPASA